jgi:hypothetical protein
VDRAEWEIGHNKKGKFFRTDEIFGVREKHCAEGQ